MLDSDIQPPTISQADVPPYKNNRGGSLEYWRSEIRDAIQYRQRYGLSGSWSRYENMYRGLFSPNTVSVAVMFAVARALVPQIYFRDPKVYVTSKVPGFTLHSMVLERLDNYLILETELKEQLKQLVLNDFLCGTSPLILGYDTEYGFNPSYQLQENDIDSSLGSFNKKGERIEYSNFIKPGYPWAASCHPRDFLVPWGTSSLSTAPWFAFRKMRLLSDIMDDPRYKNKGDLKGQYRNKIENTENSSPDNKTAYNPHNQLGTWVELFQIHDKKTGRIFVISLDHNQFLRDDIDYLQVDGLPADVLCTNTDPLYFWGIPDARHLAVQQEEINDIRTMAKYHRKVAILKVLYDKGSLGKEDLSKFLDGDPKAAVGIDLGGSGDIRKAVALLQSHVPPDLSIAAREVREDIRESVGFSRNQTGSFEAPSGRRSATEAQIVQTASLLRINERRDLMADILARTIRKYNQMVFTNWNSQRVVDIIGDDGVRYWVTFTGKEIRGEYHYKIDPEDGNTDDRNTRIARGREFIEIAKTIPGLDMSYVLQQYARQFDWLDPRMLLPNSGAGRNPERAVPLNVLAQKYPGATRSKFSGALGNG